MPRGDGTGPNGAGPRTGSGAGYCNGYRTPGYASAGRYKRAGRKVSRRRGGLGRGLGRKRR